MKKHLIVAAILTSVVIIGILKNMVFAEYKVDGNSMQPTLPEGEYFFINKWSYWFHDIDRFDIVVFQLPEENEVLVKRVIGLPGDEIQYKGNHLYINNQKVNEPFLPKQENEIFNQTQTGDFTLEEVTGVKQVPEDAVFVIGDNRLNSRDSRHFGFVKTKHIIGKVNPK